MGLVGGTAREEVRLLMLKNFNSQRDLRRRCDGFSRRDVLQVGSLAAFGLTVGPLLWKPVGPLLLSTRQTGESRL